MRPDANMTVKQANTILADDEANPEDVRLAKWVLKQIAIDKQAAGAPKS